MTLEDPVRRSSGCFLGIPKGRRQDRGARPIPRLAAALRAPPRARRRAPSCSSFERSPPCSTPCSRTGSVHFCFGRFFLLWLFPRDSYRQNMRSRSRSRFLTASSCTVALYSCSLFGSISASLTACLLRGYGRASTQNDRLGMAVVLSTSMSTPVQWACRRRCRNIAVHRASRPPIEFSAYGGVVAPRPSAVFFSTSRSMPTAKAEDPRRSEGA